MINIRKILIPSLFVLLPTCFIFASEPKVRVGDKFPQIELKHLKTEKKFKTSDIKGKVVLIDFWGSDCPPCRLALPELNKLYLKYKDREFYLLGINVDDDDELTEAFLKEYKIDYILLDDRSHQFVKRMGVDVMPTSYLIDQRGFVVHINRGFKKSDSKVLEDKIELLLIKRDGRSKSAK